MFFQGEGELRAAIASGDKIQRAAIGRVQGGMQRSAAGQEPKMPEENYYGWLVNEKLPELQALF